MGKHLIVIEKIVDLGDSVSAEPFVQGVRDAVSTLTHFFDDATWTVIDLPEVPSGVFERDWVNWATIDKLGYVELWENEPFPGDEEWFSDGETPIVFWSAQTHIETDWKLAKWQRQSEKNDAYAKEIPWHEAPEWANWFTIDENGQSTWWGNRPYADSDGIWYLNTFDEKIELTNVHLETIPSAWETRIWKKP